MTFLFFLAHTVPDTCTFNGVDGIEDGIEKRINFGIDAVIEGGIDARIEDRIGGDQKDLNHQAEGR